VIIAIMLWLLTALADIGHFGDIQFTGVGK